jgi:di/tricarboxylate transporter
VPELPSVHAGIALLLSLITFGLFATARIRVELICLGLIAVLALLFHFFPIVDHGHYTGMEIAFGGFSHEALVAICCLMIIGRGLLVTGALEPAANSLARLWRFNRSLGLLCSLLLAMGLSMFVNDTPVLVLCLPLLLTIAARAGIPASKTLMPVNCAILMGGMATTIGTSTNLLVVSIAKDLGQPRIDVFAFTSIVLVAAAFALPYLWFVMPRLLPAIDTMTGESKRRYEAALHVTQASRIPDRALDAWAVEVGGGQITGILKGDGRRLPLRAGSAAVAVGDALLMAGSIEQLRSASDALKAPLAEPDVLAHVRTSAVREKQNPRIAEVVVGSESTLIGQTVKSARLADRYGVAVLGAAHAAGAPFQMRSTAVAGTLNVGDVLLVQGTPERLVALELGEGALLLEGGFEVPHGASALWALSIAAAVVALAASNMLPLAIAALAGTIAMVVTGCVRFETIGRALKLEVIVLIAASIALGRALVETGAADWLASVFAFGLHGLPRAAALAALMIFATVLTNFVSNAAAAAVGTPLAVSLAAQLGAPAEPFVLAILFGCNLSYVTPMAYQTNLLIMSAAGYRFSDFVRAGLPLALLMVTILAYLLVRHYGL